MHMVSRTIMILLALLSISMSARAAWEAEIKAGYNSNINHSLEEEEGDSYLSALIDYRMESRNFTSLFNWTMDTMIQGGAYAGNSDLDYLGVAVVPALLITPEARWLVRLGPYVDAHALRDSDQSAVNFGAMLAVDEIWPHAFYSTQYYNYKDNNARIDTYSYHEHTLGIVLGRGWGVAFWSEIGYEYTTGASFITIPVSTTTTVSTTGGYGRGSRQHYSTTYDADVLQDDITRHTGSFTLGYGGEYCTPYLGYRYSREHGDLGTTTTHEAFAGIRWKI